ncbi:hypothetical protein ZWY2020_033693 [Hordeum vulgare]|nr:hypothetical protein ZWY2020_033693 [Hordeum vulgare]
MEDEAGDGDRTQLVEECEVEDGGGGEPQLVEECQEEEIENDSSDDEAAVQRGTTQLVEDPGDGDVELSQGTQVQSDDEGLPNNEGDVKDYAKDSVDSDASTEEEGATGMDAQVAYGFHHLRDEKPYLAQGPVANKIALKMAMARIKLLRNKKEVQVHQMRREVAQLLDGNQDQTTRIRVEHVIREEKFMHAYDLIEVYCKLIVARMSIIDSQKLLLNERNVIHLARWAVPVGSIPTAQSPPSRPAAASGEDWFPMASKQMEEIQRKLAVLAYPRAWC